MMDFQIKRTSRHCHATERELKPGETFFSDLVQEDDELVRRDFCEKAWQGPDASSLGWWKAMIPVVEGGRVYWAPRDVLLAYFDSLSGKPQHQPTAYVMALVLVRKRILQLVDSATSTEGEVLEVRHARDNKTYTVPVVQLTPEQINQIQQELGEQLFMDQPPE